MSGGRALTGLWTDEIEAVDHIVRQQIRDNARWLMDEPKHLADAFFWDLEYAQTLYDDFGRLVSHVWPPDPRPSFPAPAGRITFWRGQWVRGEHGPRPYIKDDAGRRWLLDGSGDVA